MGQPSGRTSASAAVHAYASRLYYWRQSMGPGDRDDLISLVTRIQAIERTDRGKAAVARELREKLQRCLTNGWLPEPALVSASTRGAARLASNAAASIS